MTEIETTFDDSGLQIYFVIKSGLNEIEDVSNDMSIAYTNIQEYFSTSESLKWITESECLKVTQLTKKDIFVLEEFNGAAFDYLKSTESLIIGPRCLISCLLETIPIPSNKSPVFTTAMRNLYVCASGLSLAEKAKIKKLVHWMGGFYCDDLRTICTHLISNTVQSSKYEQAALTNKQIMHPNWVSNVWERSQKENILATSKEFDEHKLPIFYNLNITSTGLPIDKRNHIKKLVIENGGKYDGRFQSKETDILILEKSSTDSQKYKTAVEFKKECLLPAWITDSVSKGYALPLKSYRVRAIKVSTPTKNYECLSLAEFNPDSTELSEISQFMSGARSNCTINETCSSRNQSQISFKPPNNQISTKKSYKEIINQLDSFSSRDIKKAGSFLDGCRIYLCGFDYDEKEKLNKILNSGGAIRYEDINENVTHIIVGESMNQLELKSIQNQTQLMGTVTLNWLLESLKLRQPADENNFVYRAKLSVVREPEAPSPSSKKTIQSMNHSFKKPVLRRKLNLDSAEANSKRHEPENNDFEEDLLQQYNPQNISAAPLKYPTHKPKANARLQSSHLAPKPTPASTTQASTSTFRDDDDDDESFTGDTDQYDFFEGLAIYVHETENEDLRKQLTIYCENAGGKVVSSIYKQIVDYVIVPSERTTDLRTIPVKGNYIVNNFWLEDAMFNNTLVEQKYFHKPIPPTADKKPLKGINIVISIYTKNERLFLQSLIQVLGAKSSEVYMKKECPLLVCPSPEGAKYQAAIQWKHPVVNADWLLECAKLGEKVDLHPYLVGEAIVDEIWKKYQFKITNEAPQTSAEKSNVMDVDLDKDDDVFIVPQNPVTEERKDIENQQNENCRTPDNLVLRHRRLSQLTEQHNKRSNSSTPTAAEDSPLTNFVKQFTTPNRQCIYEVCKEMENKETPPTQRLRRLIETPGKEKKSTPQIPKFCTTPEVEKRRYAYYDQFYIPKRERRLSTPLSEIKKKFWQQALGEHYWEPEARSQQIGFDDNALSAATATATTSSRIPQEGQHEPTQNPTGWCNPLSDFIKNRESGVNEDKKQMYDNEDDNECRSALLQKFDSEMGGTEELVGWKDPSEFLPARRNTNRMRHQGVPIFSISCAGEELKKKIIERIKTLGGQICGNLTIYDEKCTHIVCDKPNRGEKILSCIAAGKWVLSLKYVEDSCAEGAFMDEEQYEWGNPKASNLPSFERTENSIANAAFRWRKKLNKSAEKSRGAFSDFRCILHGEKVDSFRRLITAGGGVVLNVRPPYSKSAEALGATHCLVEMRTTAQLTRTDHNALKNAGVNVLSIVYLNAYLTSELQPDCSKYMLSI